MQNPNGIPAQFNRRSFLSLARGSAVAAFFPAWAFAQWKYHPSKVEVELRFPQKFSQAEVQFHRRHLENHSGLESLFREFVASGCMIRGTPTFTDHSAQWTHRFANRRSAAAWYRQVQQRGLVNRNYMDGAFSWSVRLDDELIS